MSHPFTLFSVGQNNGTHPLIGISWYSISKTLRNLSFGTYIEGCWTKGKPLFLMSHCPILIASTGFFWTCVSHLCPIVSHSVLSIVFRLCVLRVNLYLIFHHTPIISRKNGTMGHMKLNFT